MPLTKLDGINIFIALIAEHLISLGYKVSVAGIGEVNPIEYAKNFGIYRLPEFIKLSDKFSSDLKNEYYFQKGLRRLLRDGEWDLVIHNGITIFTGRKFNLLICHDWEPNGWNRNFQIFIQKILYGRRGSKVAATSPEIKAELVSLIQKDVSIIPTCVKYEKGDTVPFESRYRITHVGMQHYKNPIQSLQMFKKLLRDDLVLTYIGLPTEELKEKLQTENLDLIDRIEFKSNLEHEEYRKVMEQSLFCSVPSTYSVGVLSPTCLDAFANGAPVIGSGLSATLFIDGHNGYALENALSINTLTPEKWQELSANASQTARHFSVAHSCNQILKSFESKFND